MTIPSNANHIRWQTNRASNPLAEWLARLSEHADALASGQIHEATIVCGPPGLGKSYALLEACRARKRGVMHIKSATDFGLLEDLETAARRRYIAIIDDSDAIWASRSKLQILLEATKPSAPGDHRRYRHRTKTEERVYCFDNLVSMIISNTDITDLPRFGRSVRPALQALADRCATIVIKASREDIYEHTCSLAILDEIFRSNTVAVQNDALRWFAIHRDYLHSVTPRMLAKIIETRRAFPATWEQQLRLRLQLDEDVEPMYVPEDEIPCVLPTLKNAA